MSAKKLVLIDGYNFLFRAFYAIRNLTRSDGLPTGALFGFTRMVMNVLVDIKSTHIAVVFDTGKKNFRHKIYSQYKANRPPAPEELMPQFPLARMAVEALNVHIIEKVGYEADDVIATLAKKAEAQDFEVLIISSDKDLWQLVTDKVFIYDAIKKQKIGIPEVKEKWEVKPTELLDLLSLTGDSSDNVPGVPGIGPKTAALLIHEYGTAEGVIKNVEDIKQEKRRESIKENIENIKLSKKLITLDTNVDVGASLKDLEIKDLDPEAFIKFLNSMEFRSIAKKIGEAFGVATIEEGSKQEETETEADDLFAPKDEPVKKADEQPLPPEQLKPSEHKPIPLPQKDLFKVEGKADSEVVAPIKLEPAKNVIAFETLSQLQDLIKQAKQNGKLYLNIQTEKVEYDAKIVSLSLSTSSSEILYIKIKNENDNKKLLDLFAKKETKAEPAFPMKAIVKEMREILSQKSILKIGYDIKKQIKILNEFETELYPIEDVSVMSYILDAGVYAQQFSKIAEQNLKNPEIKKWIEILEKYEKGKAVSDLTDKEQEFAYFQMTSIRTLHKLFKQRLNGERMNFIYERFERPMTRILADMEIAGVKVDVVEMNKLSSDFTKQIAKLEKEIHTLAGEEFNIGSPKQLGQILFTKLKIPATKKSYKSGLYSTDMEVLETLALQGHEIAEKVLEWRHYSKLKTTYTDVLPKLIHKKTGRIHTTFSNTTASTGRLSSNNPNLQNIPIRSEAGTKIRKAFVSQRGYKLISADYSQVELRVLAHYAKVKELIKNFKEDKDVHAITASKVFEVAEKDVTKEMRRTAKAINFSIVYGTSPYGLAKRIKSDYADAKLYIDNYFKLYPEIKEYMENSKEFAKKNGYVKSLFGRKCHIDMNKKGALRGFAERLAINAPMQGTAADIIKKAMIDLYYELKKAKLNAKILLQVHDELILEATNADAPAVAKLLKKTMEGTVTLDVPLPVEVSVGDNWAEIH